MSEDRKVIIAYETPDHPVPLTFRRIFTALGFGVLAIAMLLLGVFGGVALMFVSVAATWDYERLIFGLFSLFAGFLLFAWCVRAAGRAVDEE